MLLLRKVSSNARRLQVAPDPEFDKAPLTSPQQVRVFEYKWGNQHVFQLGQKVCWKEQREWGREVAGVGVWLRFPSHDISKAQGHSHADKSAQIALPSIIDVLDLHTR